MEGVWSDPVFAGLAAYRTYFRARNLLTSSDILFRSVDLSADRMQIWLIAPHVLETSMVAAGHEGTIVNF